MIQYFAASNLGLHCLPFSSHFVSSCRNDEMKFDWPENFILLNIFDYLGFLIYIVMVKDQTLIRTCAADLDSPSHNEMFVSFATTRV